LNQSPIAFRHFRGSEVERISSRHQKSRSHKWRQGVLRSLGSQHSGVGDMKEVPLREKNREVLKTCTRDTWQNHVVGPKNRQVDMH
jgi:hypothetical protein